MDVIAIERNRSEFYDAKYRTNMTKLGVYEVKEYYQMQVQQYLKDDGKTGFSTLFGDIANLKWGVGILLNPIPVKLF